MTPLDECLAVHARMAAEAQDAYRAWETSETALDAARRAVAEALAGDIRRGDMVTLSLRDRGTRMMRRYRVVALDWEVVDGKNVVMLGAQRLHADGQPFGGRYILQANHVVKEETL